MLQSFQPPNADNLGGKRLVVNRSSWVGLLADLHPLNRVHNGPEFERALHMIADWIARSGLRGKSEIKSYPAGAEFNWWKVPPRWHVRKFEVLGPDGNRVAGLGDHPLTLTPYSSSFRGSLSRDELLSRVHSRADLPDAAPFIFRRMYRHWEKGWGIALPRNLRDSLPEGLYDVTIETELTDEPMQLLEYRAAGKSDLEVQLAGHLDHPGQANDSLSGVVASLCVAREFQHRHPDAHYSVSVLAVPEIVGTSVYLHQEEETRRRLRYALCPNMLGHDAPIAICTSRNGDSQLDRALQLAAMTRGVRHVVGEWHKYPDCGDEISYDAPGYDIPASTVSRIGELYPFYHSSSDTPEAVDPDRFEEATMVMVDALSMLERNALPVARFTGLPALANPALGLYLEPSNMNNAVNPSGRSALTDLHSGKPLDARLFQEFFLANMRGNATLMDIAYEYGAPFEFVETYANAFGAKQLARLERPISDADYSRATVMTARARSGHIDFGAGAVRR